MSKRIVRMPFVRFCTDVLHIELTLPWVVLLRIAVDGIQPRDLEGEERELARQIFGAVDEIDPRLRRILVWRLGRASGKTTIASALAIYTSWTSDLSRVGPGHTPCAFVVSPSKPLARIAVGVARELVRGSALERHVVDEGDSNEGFMLARPDGRRVAIRCVAASRGGANLRGVDVIVLVLDESEFFASNSETGVDGYSVTDRDQIDAVMPRLIGFVVCSSTPWPADTFTGEAFDKNHGKPTDAVAALGTSMFMRPTAQLEIDRAREMARDPENEAREYDCVPGVRGGSRIFVEGLAEAVVHDRPLSIRAPQGAVIGAGGDLGLERDSSAIAIACSLAEVVEVLEYDEVRPAKGTPLAPGYVVRDRFAPIMRNHRVSWIFMDAHYRQSAIEHLTAMGLNLADAPTGIEGKYDVYMHVRALLRAGQLRLPNSPRLLGQMRAVVATPLPQGKTRISSPRRVGGGHGDIVSALVLSCWAVKATEQGNAQHRAQLERRRNIIAMMNRVEHGDDPGFYERMERQVAEKQRAMIREATRLSATEQAQLEDRLQWNHLLWRQRSPVLTPADIEELRAHGRIPKESA